MTDKMHDFFKEFWSDLKDPLHRSEDSDYLLKYGMELKILIGEREPESVLELGCGTGTFFSQLGFDLAKRYVGVDFSQSMLEQFSITHNLKALNGLELICHDASSLLLNEKFDLIFSNAMVQNFSLRMFSNLLTNCQKMLAPGGNIILASIPWKALRTSYFNGEAAADPSAVNRVKGILTFLSSRSRLNGRWYTCNEISNIAADKGFQADFFGSLHYPYRMHVVLRGQ